MKLFSFTLILLIVSFIVVNGQDSLKTSTNENIAYIIRTMQHELDISKEQCLTIKDLLSERFTAREQASLEPKRKFEMANANTLKRLQKLLTVEQYQKYQQLKEEKQQQKAKYLRDHPGYKFSEEDEMLDF